MHTRMRGQRRTYLAYLNYLASSADVLEFLYVPTLLYFIKLPLSRPSPEMHSAAISGVSVEPSDDFEAQTGTAVVSVLCQTNLGLD